MSNKNNLLKVGLWISMIVLSLWIIYLSLNLVIMFLGEIGIEGFLYLIVGLTEEFFVFAVPLWAIWKYLKIISSNPKAINEKIVFRKANLIKIIILWISLFALLIEFGIRFYNEIIVPSQVEGADFAFLFGEFSALFFIYLLPLWAVRKFQLTLSVSYKK
jgi:hypothetical protein